MFRKLQLAFLTLELSIVVFLPSVSFGTVIVSRNEDDPSLNTSPTLQAFASILQTQVSPVNGHTYHLLTVDTWTNSEATAVSLGGHLATVRNLQEQNWIWQTFGIANQRHLWIGLNDVAVEGTFRWSSGEALTYTNWTSSEPNNNPIWRPENWVHLDGYRNGEWNDVNEGIPSSVILPLQGVVEISSASNTVPEPTSAAIAVVLSCFASLGRRMRAIVGTSKRRA